MPNVPDASKERITYAEFSLVREELIGIAKDLGDQEGREVTESEVLRRFTLELANKRRRAMGKKALTLDPSTKPGGTPNTRRSARAA